MYNKTNKSYNNRQSGRFNSPGRFVPAGELQQSYGQVRNEQQQQPQLPQQQQPQVKQQQQIHKPQLPISNSLISLTEPDVNMKQELEPPQLEQEQEQEPETDDGPDVARPPWMKTKLAGVKKVSNKERRRRQNEHLRRLLTPKNALMVLNEMMPNNEQFTNQFKVHQAGVSQFYNTQSPYTFCADLTLEGNTYKGFGDNKMMARNAAAEQAIRDLIIKKMTKALITEDTSEASDGPAGDGSDSDETLPMIQLASFALHKLFTEWEYEGHKVPQLKGAAAGAARAAAGAGAEGAEEPPRPRPARSRSLPPNAHAMHPCMLLTLMRPAQEYRELGLEGDRPQNMVFTMGVLVDGTHYIGKASNKREARKAAARSACEALFGVKFDPICTANAPAAE